MTSDAFSTLDLYGVLHGLPVGVTLADEEGRIVFSNATADRILGMPAAVDATPDAWSQRYGVFLTDGSTPFPTAEYPLVRALSGEETHGVEMVIRNESVPDGAVISVSGRALHGPDGSITGAAVVFRDITSLRRMERLREELSTFIVHDLKNPLASITATCDLMAGDVSDDSLLDDIRAIRESAARIHRMVLDLLDIQMADDGVLELVPSKIEVARLLAEVADASSRRLASRGQTIAVGDADGLTVDADRPLILRVLMNLVDNCAKYGPENGTVWIDAAASDGGVVIRVRDEGPGVPPHLRERIFEKYAQVEREEGMRSRDSRGLGLRFCHVVAEAHGGRIWVEDGQPRGARFCLELPAVP